MSNTPPATSVRVPAAGLVCVRSGLARHGPEGSMGLGVPVEPEGEGGVGGFPPTP